MKWDNTDVSNKIKWTVKKNRPDEYQTLSGTAAEFRKFLNTQPDIKTIALELTGLVDLLLVTGNRGWIGDKEEGEFQLLDTWQKRIPFVWTAGKIKFVEKDLRKWVEKNVKKYSEGFGMPFAPWINVLSGYTFTYQVGFCEEHSALACYLLIWGGLHPESTPPFQKLHVMYKNRVLGDPRDIYFSILGASEWSRGNHGFVVLFKGDEFAESVMKLKEYFKGKGEKDLLRGKVFEYIFQHPELWGKKAWVVDGWLGYSYPAADIQKTFFKEFGMYNFKLFHHPDWNPFHFGDLFLRVCEHYNITWE